MAGTNLVEEAPIYHGSASAVPTPKLGADIREFENVAPRSRS